MTTEAEKSKRRPKRSRAKAPVQSEPTPEADQPETSAANLEFGEVLQAEIAQAVEPVLAEFRQQVARAVEEQLESDPPPGRDSDKSREGANEASTASVPQSQSVDSSSENGGATSSQGRQSEGAPESGTAGSTPDEQESKASAATGTAETSGQTDDAEDQEQPQSQGQTAEQSSQQEQPQAEMSPSDGSQGEEPESKTASAPKRLLAGGLQLAEQQGEKWLQSMVVAGITALLAESSKTAAQQRAEQGLHTLLTKGFAAAPEGTLSPELQGQIERTSQAILRDTIEALFSEDVRTSIVQESSEAVGAAVHGDFGAATNDVRSAAMAVVDELVRVLRRQWQRILRLLFKAVLAALENAITDDDGDSAITSKSKKALGG